MTNRLKEILNEVIECNICSRAEAEAIRDAVAFATNREGIMSTCSYSDYFASRYGPVSQTEANKLIEESP